MLQIKIGEINQYHLVINLTQMSALTPGRSESALASNPPISGAMCFHGNPPNEAGGVTCVGHGINKLVLMSAHTT